jgi:hypothetical protein
MWTFPTLTLSFSQASLFLNTCDQINFLCSRHSNSHNSLRFLFMLHILNVQRKGVGIILNLSVWYKTRTPEIPWNEKQGVIILGSIRRFKERQNF